MNLKENIYLYVNSTTQRCPNEIIKTFFSFATGVTLSCEYLHEFSQKIQNGINVILRGLGETDSWKNLENLVLKKLNSGLNVVAEYRMSDEYFR